MSIKISVITICYNNKDELIRTCKSVDLQIDKPFEHIIIDGSNNNLIKDYLESHPQPLYRNWICEADKGISDAFNKGIKNPFADIIHFLNSGDVYYNENVLKIVKESFSNDITINWLHGKYIQFRGGVWVISGKRFNKKKLFMGMRTVAHPTMFVKKNLFAKYGEFDPNKKIAMDYDFLIRIRNEKFIFLDEIVVSFNPGGASTRNFFLSLKEVRKSYFKFKGFNPLVYILNLRSALLHIITDTFIGKLIFKIKNKKNLVEKF